MGSADSSPVGVANDTPGGLANEAARHGCAVSGFLGPDTCAADDASAFSPDNGRGLEPSGGMNAGRFHLAIMGSSSLGRPKSRMLESLFGNLEPTSTQDTRVSQTRIPRIPGKKALPDTSVHAFLLLASAPPLTFLPACIMRGH